MKKPATKSSKKRPSKRRQIIVLVDGAENYYELPRAVLERSRVSDRRKAEVTAALEELRTQEQADHAAALKPRLDQAVKDGTLTQAEADAVTKAAEKGVIGGHR